MTVHGSTALGALSDLDGLTQGLGHALGGIDPGRVTVLDRSRNQRASYYPSEVVTCRINGEPSLRLLVKYGVVPHDRDQGQPVGPEYEAAIYRNVLDRLRLSTPRFYGDYTDEASGCSWLFLEYIDGEHPDRVSDQTTTVAAAAAWIGRFHALNETRVVEPSLQLLTRFTAEYYRRWPQRVLEFGCDRAGEEWLSTVRQRYEQVVALLTAPPPTVIHGDYYTDNVLFHDGTIRPFDWERAAVGAGVIDLASLTHGWHTELVEACDRAYADARWPRGSPSDFHVTLAAARVHVLCRLLGERPNWPDPEMWAWRLGLLLT